MARVHRLHAPERAVEDVRAGRRLHEQALAGQQVGAGDAAERLVWLEPVAHLVDRGPATEARQTAYELDVGEVPGRQLVVAALSVEGELLDRPRTDLPDAAQAPPAALVVAVVQVDAPGRDLARAEHERERAPGGEVARLELGGRAAGHRGRRRGVAKRAARRPSAVAPGEPPLYRERAVDLDQLLGDRPLERLERIGDPRRPQPRLAADDRPEKGVATELRVERREVVVQVDRVAHALERVGGRLARRALRPQPHRAPGRPGGYDGALVPVVDGADERATATPEHAVAAGAREPVGPLRPNVDFEG